MGEEGGAKRGLRGREIEPGMTLFHGSSLNSDKCGVLRINFLTNQLQRHFILVLRGKKSYYFSFVREKHSEIPIFPAFK